MDYLHKRVSTQVIFRLPLPATVLTLNTRFCKEARVGWRATFRFYSRSRLPGARSLCQNIKSVVIVTRQIQLLYKELRSRVSIIQLGAYWPIMSMAQERRCRDDEIEVSPGSYRRSQCRYACHKVLLDLRTH